MNSYTEIENILAVYSLEDILDQNELTEADALLFMVEEDFVKLPKIRPLDFE